MRYTPALVLFIAVSLWAFIYWNEAFRKTLPSHCKNTVYPDHIEEDTGSFVKWYLNKCWLFHVYLKNTTSVQSCKVCRSSNPWGLWGWNGDGRLLVNWKKTVNSIIDTTQWLNAKATVFLTISWWLSVFLYFWWGHVKKNKSLFLQSYKPHCSLTIPFFPLPDAVLFKTSNAISVITWQGVIHLILIFLIYCFFQSFSVLIYASS